MVVEVRDHVIVIGKQNTKQSLEGYLQSLSNAIRRHTEDINNCVSKLMAFFGHPHVAQSVRWYGGNKGIFILFIYM